MDDSNITRYQKFAYLQSLTRSCFQELEAENSSLSNTVRQFNEDVLKLESDNTTLIAKINEINEKNVDITNQYNASIGQKIEEYEQKLNSQQNEIDELLSKNAVMGTANKNLLSTYKHKMETQNKLLSSKLEDVNQKALKLQEENERFKADILVLKDENQTHKLNTEAQNKFHSQIAKINENTIGLQKENERLREEISALSIENNKKELQAEAEIETLNKTLTEINEKAVKLQNENERLEEKMTNMDIDYKKQLYEENLKVDAGNVSHNQKLCAANEKATKLQEENDKLKVDIKNLQIENKSDSYKHKLELTSLMNRYEDLQKIVNNISISCPENTLESPKKILEQIGRSNSETNNQSSQISAVGVFFLFYYIDRLIKTFHISYFLEEDL